MPDYLSLTELAHLYGVSRNKVGEWLVNLGLRAANKKPCAKAFNEGVVDQRDSTLPGTYFRVWHGEKTTRLLDEAGHVRADQQEA
jgi:hypothetical protein